MLLSSVPGDMFWLEIVSDFRCVTGALSLISVIVIINVAYDASVRKRRMGSVESSAPAGCCDSVFLLTVSDP